MSPLPCAPFADVARSGRSAQPAPSRGGFTLVELLVVVAIIAILAAFILPAIVGTAGSAQQLETQTEMTRFDEALIAFQREYNQYPPSFFVFHEDPSQFYNPTNPLGLNADEERLRDDSLRTIRRLFGDEFDFAQAVFDPAEGGDDGDVATFDLNGVDSDGDGDEENDLILMNGAECLVFFLGGMMVEGSAGSQVPIGFSRSGVFPFSLVQSANRTPAFEFDTERFVDIDGDGMLEYADAFTNQQTPYLYLSAYGGSGYRPAGLNDTIDTAADTRDDDTIVINDGVNTTLIGPRFAYHKIDEGGQGGVDLKQAWNADTYQILSPGPDGLYGTGGGYDADNGLANEAGNKSFGALNPTNLNLADPSLLNGSALQRNPQLEQDNMTNFTGRLGG